MSSKLLGVQLIDPTVESCRVGGQGGDACGCHPVDQEPGIPVVLPGGLLLGFVDLRLLVRGWGNPTYILVALSALHSPRVCWGYNRIIYRPLLPFTGRNRPSGCGNITNG